MYHHHGTVSPGVPGGVTPVTPSHGHVQPPGCYVVQCSACRGGCTEDGLQQIGVYDLDTSGYSHHQLLPQSQYAPTYYRHQVAPSDMEFQPIDRIGAGQSPGPSYRYTQYHQPYVEQPAASPYHHHQQLQPHQQHYPYQGPVQQAQFGSHAAAPLQHDVGCHTNFHVSYSPAPHHHRNLPQPPPAAVAATPQYTSPLHYTGGHPVVVCNPPPDSTASSSSASIVGVPQLVLYGTSGPSSSACCQCGPASASPLTVEVAMRSHEGGHQFVHHSHGGVVDGMVGNSGRRSHFEDEQTNGRDDKTKEPPSRGESQDGGTDVNTSAVAPTVNGPVHTPRTARRSVMASALRGTPLYGQPDWWGEDDHLMQQQQQQAPPQPEQRPQLQQQQHNEASSKTSKASTAETLWAEAAKKMTSPAARPNQLKLEAGFATGTNGRQVTDASSQSMTPPERDHTVAPFVPLQSLLGESTDNTPAPTRSVLPLSGSPFQVNDTPAVELSAHHHMNSSGSGYSGQQVIVDGHVQSDDQIHALHDPSIDQHPNGYVRHFVYQSSMNVSANSLTLRARPIVPDTSLTHAQNTLALSNENRHGNVIDNVIAPYVDGGQYFQTRAFEIPSTGENILRSVSAVVAGEPTTSGGTPPRTQSLMHTTEFTTSVADSQRRDGELEQKGTAPSSSALRRNESCDVTVNSAALSCRSVTSENDDDITVSRAPMGGAAFTVSFGDSLDLSLNISSCVPLALQRRQTAIKPSSRQKQQQQQQEQQPNEVTSKTPKIKKSTSFGESTSSVSEATALAKKKQKTNATSVRRKTELSTSAIEEAKRSFALLAGVTAPAPAVDAEHKLHTAADVDADIDDGVSDAGTYTIDSDEGDEEVKEARRNIVVAFGVDESGNEAPSTPTRKRVLPPVPDMVTERPGTVDKHLEMRIASDEPPAAVHPEVTSSMTVEWVDIHRPPSPPNDVIVELPNCKTSMGGLEISELSSAEDTNSEGLPVSSSSITQTDRVCPPAVKLKRKTILVREQRAELNEEQVDKQDVVIDVRDLHRNLDSALVPERGRLGIANIPTTSGPIANMIQEGGGVVSDAVLGRSSPVISMTSCDLRPVAITTSAVKNSPAAVRRSAFRNGGQSLAEQGCLVFNGSPVDPSGSVIPNAPSEKQRVIVEVPVISEKSPAGTPTSIQRATDRVASSNSRLTTATAMTATPVTTSRSTEHRHMIRVIPVVPSVSQQSTSGTDGSMTVTRSRSTLGTVSTPSESKASVSDSLPAPSLSSSMSSTAPMAAFRRRGSSPISMTTARRASVDPKPTERGPSSTRDGSATRTGTRSVFVSGSGSTHAQGIRARSITRTVAGQEKAAAVGRSLSASRRPPSPTSGATFAPISKPPPGDGATRVPVDSSRVVPPMRQPLTPRSPDKHMTQARRSVVMTTNMTSSPGAVRSRTSRSINRSSMTSDTTTADVSSSSSSSPMLDSSNITELSRTVSSQLRAITMAQCLNGSRDANGSRDSVGTTGSNESETASSDSSTANNNNGQVPCNEVMIESIYALCRRIHRSVTQIHNKQRSTRLPVDEEPACDSDKSNNGKLSKTLSLLTDTEQLLKKLAS